MNEKQKKVLAAAAKTKLKNEGILTGGAEYTNPAKKSKKKVIKKKSWLDSLFSWYEKRRKKNH